MRDKCISKHTKLFQYKWNSIAGGYNEVTAIRCWWLARNKFSNLTYYHLWLIGCVYLNIPTALYFNSVIWLHCTVDITSFRLRWLLQQKCTYTYIHTDKLTKMTDLSDLSTEPFISYDWSRWWWGYCWLPILTTVNNLISGTYEYLPTQAGFNRKTLVPYFFVYLPRYISPCKRIGRNLFSGGSVIHWKVFINGLTKQLLQ